MKVACIYVYYSSTKFHSSNLSSYRDITPFKISVFELSALYFWVDVHQKFPCKGSHYDKSVPQIS